MSYERKMLEELVMPSRKLVEQSLLRMLLKNNGTIKEFGSGHSIVDELADEFGLSEKQRSAYLETVYRKENRVKKAILWHRLLYRAADSLAKENSITRPTQTILLTKKKEWMLTEKGLDNALKLCNMPRAIKQNLPTRSFEVQSIVKKLTDSPPQVANYDPFDKSKGLGKTTKESVIRDRGFRLAVIEAYKYKCAVCGLKLNSPDSLMWEVQAAHIVPNSSLGRDDICNGIALCRLHHWAFDVGWFTLLNDYKIRLSSQAQQLPADFGSIGDHNLIKDLRNKNMKIVLPMRNEIQPHPNAMRWHRENIFCQ